MAPARARAAVARRWWWCVACSGHQRAPPPTLADSTVAWSGVVPARARVPGGADASLLTLPRLYLRYLALWLHGDIRQYDITDRAHPRLVGQVRQHHTAMRVR
jgi:56kDa selenium binding protein (SBP56)